MGCMHCMKTNLTENLNFAPKMLKFYNPIKINVFLSVCLSVVCPLEMSLPRNFGPLGTIRMKSCVHYLGVNKNRL